MAGTAQPIDLGAHPELRETVAAVAEAVSVCIGKPIERISIPGGTERVSLRVHFADGTLIGTRRPNHRARRYERRVLRALADQGAPVPRLLGEHGEVTLQEDAGPYRLSEVLLRSSPDQRRALTARAFESVWRIKEAADKAGLTGKLRPVGTQPAWIRRFVAAPARASAMFPGVRRPALDTAALAESLGAEPDVFVNWDARLGNAGVRPDGQLIWFDWEYYGRRAGVEDLAYLIADEFFPLPPRAALAVFVDTRPQAMKRHFQLLVRFAALRAARRLMLIRERWQGQGEEDLARLLRTDIAGYSPQTVKNLCKHGAGYAARDPLTAPLEPWFEQVADPARWTDDARLAAE